MIEKISFYLTMKSSANDEKIILESTKKSQNTQTKKAKEDEEVFNQLIEQRNNEERNRVNLKKKVRRQDDIQNLIVPLYIPQPPNIEEHYLLKLGNKKKKKCSKCGEIYESSYKKGEKNDINICQDCLNKNIESFLRENYL